METRLKSVRVMTGQDFPRVFNGVEIGSNRCLLRADAYNIDLYQQLCFTVEITDQQFETGDIEAAGQQAITGLEKAIVDQFGNLDGWIAPPTIGGNCFIVGDQESAKIPAP